MPRHPPPSRSRELGQRLAVVADVVDREAVDREAEQRAGRRHPVVGVGAPRPVGRAAGRARRRGRPRSPSSSRRAPSSSAASAARRSVSWPRRWPMPVMVLRPVRERREAHERRGELAASRRGRGRTGAAARDERPRRRRPSARRASRRTVGAERRQQLAEPVADLRRLVGPVGDRHRAAGDQRRGEERRGVRQVGLDRRRRARGCGAAATPQTRRGSRPSCSACTPRRRERVDRHLDVRHATAAGSPRVLDHQPVGKRGAGRAAGRRRTGSTPTRRWSPRRRATAPVPCTLNGSAPRPSSSTSTPRARSDSDGRRHRARRAPARRRRSATGPTASAATGGRKRISVPASPQSMSRRRRSAPA